MERNDFISGRVASGKEKKPNAALKATSTNGFEFRLMGHAMREFIQDELQVSMVMDMHFKKKKPPLR